MASIVSNGYQWGICISHDVDHMGHREHSFKNIAKFWGVCLKEVLTLRRNPFSLFRVVWNSFFTKNDSWNCVAEMCELDFKNSIPSTFFFAMEPGTGIEYTREQIRERVKRIPFNFEIGVHGQFPDNEKAVKDEFANLYNMIARRPFGIRMHYLRQGEKTHELMKTAGYVYDSTEYDDSGGLKQPYLAPEGLVEIPFHLMDTYLFSPFYENLHLKDAIKKFEALIEKAKQEQKVISIIVHQRSLSKDLPRQRKFYQWLVQRVANDKTCWKANCLAVSRGVKS